MLQEHRLKYIVLNHTRFTKGDKILDQMKINDKQEMKSKSQAQSAVQSSFQIRVSKVRKSPI